MARFLARARFIIGAWVVAARARHRDSGERAAQSGRFGQSDRKRGEGAAAPQRAAVRRRDQRPRQHPGPEVRQPDPAGRPRLAPVPRGDAALDRRDRDPRHADRAGRVLSRPRSGEARERLFGPAHRALQRVRALRALDDGDLLHHPGDLRAEHHLRQAAADAADRRGCLRGLVAVGEVRAQLSQLPVRDRRVLHFPDVDRRQHPEQGRRRMGSSAAAASSATIIRRPTASTPARR